MMGIGQGHLERGVSFEYMFQHNKCKVILQEKINPFITGGGRGGGGSNQRKRWLLGGFSSCNR